MSEFKVPVKIWVSGSAYRVLAAEAAKRKLLGVGELLEQQVELSIVSPTTKRLHRKMTPEKLNRAVQMHEAHKTLKEISDELEVSVASVHGHLKRLGLAGVRS